MIAQLTDEYGLSVTIELVRSEMNLSDRFTRVPQKWLMRGDRVVAAAAPTSPAQVELRARVAAVHHQVGHPGVRKTLWYARRELPENVRREDARAVVRGCDVCRSIDPAPVRWRHGHLGVEMPWARLAADMVHVGASFYLSVIDCGPTRFALWRQLRRNTSEEVVRELEQIFWERGAPAELILDNGSEFRSRAVQALLPSGRWRFIIAPRTRPAGTA